MKKAVIVGTLAYMAANRIAVEYRTRKVWDGSYQDIIAQCYEKNVCGACIMPKGVYAILEELVAWTIGIPFMAFHYVKGDLR